MDMPDLKMQIADELTDNGAAADGGLVTNLKDNSSFNQDANDTILRAALRAGVGMSYECNSGCCGGCKFTLLEGEVDDLWPDAPGLSVRDKARGLKLACQCKANGDIAIRAPTSNEYVPEILPKRQKAVLKEIRDITHDIREFTFACDGAAEFLAGQYAMLELPGVGSSRAYSMSNTPNPDGIWQFQIRRVEAGKGTDFLFNHIKIGNEIEIDAPYGLAFLRQESPRDIVCIAGGSGLAPMISIARGASEAGLLNNRKLKFFYGARTPIDVCGDEILKNLPQYAEFIEFIPVVSVAGIGDWDGETGFVHDILQKKLGDNFKNYEFYFAGPALMIKAVQDLLMVEKLVPFNQIHFDRFF